MKVTLDDTNHKMKPIYNHKGLVMKTQVLFLGDQRTGKTLIVKKMFDKHHHAHAYNATIGVDVSFYNYNGHDFRLYDISGQERFKFMVSHYLKTTDVIVLVCDINNIESIKHLNDWRNIVAMQERPIPIITVINKCDIILTDDKQKLVDTLAVDNQPLILVNAEKGDNISKIYDSIFETLNLEKQNQPSESNGRFSSDFFRFYPERNAIKNKEPSQNIFTQCSLM